MKTLLILLSLSSNVLLAQTSLETELLELINNYRLENGLKVVLWNEHIYTAADFHATYLLILNEDSLRTTITHIEDVDVPNFWEIKTSGERLNHFLKQPIIGLGENLAGYMRLSNPSNSDLPVLFFNCWKNSPNHNKIMLGDDYQFAGVAIVIVRKEFWTWASERKVWAFKAFAILNLCTVRQK